MNDNILIRIGEVVSIEDNVKGGRIKVRIYPKDNNTPLDELPYVMPLLPKLFHIIPKVGEAVLVILTATNNYKSNLYYIGPLFAQENDFNYCSYHGKARALYNGGAFNKLHVAHTNDPDAAGAFCDDEDIAIYGRKGTDIILKNNDIRIRSGARCDGGELTGKVFNGTTPSFLKLKYHDVPINTDSISSATLVADEINLISNKGNPKYTDWDSKEMVSDEQMNKIIETAHALPYGDVLIEFLKEFMEMFKTHAHSWANKETILPLGSERFWNWDLNSILSKHVRIN